MIGTHPGVKAQELKGRDNFVEGLNRVRGRCLWICQVSQVPMRPAVLMFVEKVIIKTTLT